jgi:hypothetical protein
MAEVAHNGNPAAYVEPQYHVVYCFRWAREDFGIEGVYTKPADADEHVARLKAARLVAASMPLAHRELVERLTADRLGALAALLKLQPPTREAAARATASLYGRDGFPVAVAREPC